MLQEADLVEKSVVSMFTTIFVNFYITTILYNRILEHVRYMFNNPTKL